tara:strand:+ start:800 stop:1138 length:339 start_codon:yes stop_codon:yes gene_type:complete
MSRTPHHPTVESKKFIKVNSGLGATHASMAGYLEICEKTLRKHYRKELDDGNMEAFTEVAGALFRSATEELNVSAMRFYLSARHGWSEKTVNENHDMTPTIIRDNIPDDGLK